jgi:hypothetical protein
MISRRYRSLDRVPYLNFARYEQLSEEEGFIVGITPYMPFKLQMSNLDDRQYTFLAVNGHSQEFIRSTTSPQWSRISQTTKEKALDLFLCHGQGFDVEGMTLALLKTGLMCGASHKLVHGEVIHFIHWAAESGYASLMHFFLDELHDIDIHVLDKD